jgi:flagellar basal-body rod protein FlgF
MIKGIYQSAAGMLARQKHLEVVANNLANVATAGFKQENVCFRETLNSNLAPNVPVTQGARFVDVESGESRVNRQGTLTQTGNPLDAAIVGDGYFTVETPGGPAYTRDGRFHLNTEGELVTLSGYRVLTAGGSNAFPQGDLRLGTDGSLVLKELASGRERVLDRLQVVTFADPTQLEHARDGLFVSKQPPVDLSQVRLEIGCLEESTVNPIAEMVKMIEINQFYDASVRSIQTQDGTLGKAVNEIAKT